MKNLLVIPAMLLLFSCSNNEAEKTSNKKDALSTDLISNPGTLDSANLSKMEQMPVMKLKDTVHDFGTIHAGEKVSYDFEFSNIGQTPLLISNTQASCACTAGEYSKEPIAPGAAGKINVKFNSEGKSGTIEKSVAVFTNSLRGTYMVYIRCNVIQ